MMAKEKICVESVVPLYKVRAAQAAVSVSSSLVSLQVRGIAAA
jgi:hypothetical protein